MQVMVPATFTEYTQRRVLTSQWIDGEKLSQSKAEDVTTLVNVGVVCFLYQLLDSGFFMADPHPGEASLPHAAQDAKINLGCCHHEEEDFFLHRICGDMIWCNGGMQATSSGHLMLAWQCWTLAS